MSSIFRLFDRKKSREEIAINKFIVQRFGYNPKKSEFFIRALTHKSMTHDDQNSNERMEFLGDAILDAVVAEYLYEKFPNEDEGYLTKIKSKVVNRRTLGKIGHEMEIRKILNYNKSRNIRVETIEGNAFEALIGALYLDGGYATAKKSIFNHVFKKYVNLNHILEEEIDFKTKLYIWSQKNRLPLNFEVIDEKNHGSHWKYTVQVSINGQNFGIGTGASKKKAEQAASKETLSLIGVV